MSVLLAAALVGGGMGLLTSPWRDERVDRLHGTAHPYPRPGAVDRIRHDLVNSRLGPAARRRRARERVAVIQALAALAADLQAGQPPNAALVAAGGKPSMWPQASGAAGVGEDVVAALIIDSERAPLLRPLAACWQVGVESGTGLAATVTQLASSARSAEDVRVQLEAELAGPRATARTLGLLPLVGVAFGVMMGADPLGWLFGSTIGRGCLAVGAALTVLGTWWTGRIAARVEAML